MRRCTENWICELGGTEIEELELSEQNWDEELVVEEDAELLWIGLELYLYYEVVDDDTSGDVDGLVSTETIWVGKRQGLADSTTPVWTREE